MPGTLRQRTRDLRYGVTGSYTYRSSGQSFERTAQQGTWDTNTDWVGNFSGDNSLTIQRDEWRYAKVNGTVSGIGGLKDIDHWPLTLLPTPEPLGRFGYVNLDNLVVTALAKMNPSAPHVSIPTFIGELKDIPSLVRSWGRNVLEWLANANLWWRFGVRPLIGDIQRIFSFQKSVANRMKWLEKLKTTGSVRRQVKLGIDLWHLDSPLTVVESAACLVKALKYEDASRTTWASSKWTLPSGAALPRMDYGQLRNLAIRLTYGIDSFEAFRTAWELLPWSWLIDWFIPVGDWLTACGNSLGLQCLRVCIMRTFVGTLGFYAFSGYPSGAEVIGDHWSRRVYKYRTVHLGTLLPTPSIPAITAGQWSILGSLAALKGRKSL